MRTHLGRTVWLAWTLVVVVPALSVVQPAKAASWSTIKPLNNARYSHTGTLLPDGRVLVAGGYNGGVLSSAELYDPASGGSTATANLNLARYEHTGTLLPNGRWRIRQRRDGQRRIV